MQSRVCLLTPLLASKLELKLLTCLTSPSIVKSIRSLIPPLTHVKDVVKVKITLALFSVKDQMYRQSYGTFDPFLTCI